MKNIGLITLLLVILGAVEVWPMFSGKHPKNLGMASIFLPEKVDTATHHVAGDSSTFADVFDILSASRRTLKIMQLGDSHIAGKTVPLTIKNDLEKVFGTSNDPEVGAGIEFSFVAKNGATCAILAAPKYMQQVANTEPDFIILSLGTNDCHGMGYHESQHEAQLTTLLKEIHKAAPCAFIMMTTPPGDYLRHRPNPMNQRCVNFIKKYGEEHGIPVFDLYEALGGSKSLQNSMRNGYLRPDRIHYTPEGYTHHGHLIAQYILNEYYTYISE